MQLGAALYAECAEIGCEIAPKLDPFISHAWKRQAREKKMQLKPILTTPSSSLGRKLICTLQADARRSMKCTNEIHLPGQLKTTSRANKLAWLQIAQLASFGLAKKFARVSEI